MPRFGSRRFRHSGPVSALCVAAGGTRIVSSSSMADETVLWNASSGERIFTAPEPASHVAYLPRQQRLLTAFAALHVFDVEQQVDVTPEAFSGLRAPMAASETDRFVAYRATDDTVVLAAVTGQRLGALQLDRPDALALSRDGQLLAVGERDAGLRVFRVGADLKITELFHERGKCAAFCFSAKGDLLLCAGPAAVTLYRSADGHVIWRRSVDMVQGVAMAPDASRCASYGFWGQVQLHSMSDGRPGVSFKVQRGEPHLGFLDADTLAYARSYAVKLCNAGSGHEVFRQDTHDAEITQIAAAASAVATASIDHSTRVWDVSSGAPLHCFEHANAVHGVALNASGSRVASVSADDTLRVWSLPDGDPVGDFERRGADLGAGGVHFSPSGTLLAVDVSDGVHVFNAADLAPVCTIAAERPKRLAFATEARLILLTDNKQSVVEIATGRILCIEVDKYDDVLAVSPDGGLCAVRIDEHVVVRDTTALREVQRMPIHLATDVAFSPAGLLICTRFNANHIELWNVAAGTLDGRIDFEARPSALCFVDARTVAVGMRDGSAETAPLPLTPQEREQQAARAFTEREERARDCLRQLALRTAPGYRDSPGRELLDADGLGLKLPALEGPQAAVRVAVQSDGYGVEVQVGDTTQAPTASFFRFGMWIRERLGLSKSDADPRVAACLHAMQAAEGVSVARVDRMGTDGVLLSARCASLPEPETLREWVARGIELGRG